MGKWAEILTGCSCIVALVPFTISQFLLGGEDACPQFSRQTLLFV